MKLKNHLARDIKWNISMLDAYAHVISYVAQLLFSFLV